MAGASTGSRRQSAAVAALFFVSGFSALVYQVCWQRVLTFHTGVGLASITLIVSAFLAGLAVGSWLGGVASARVTRPSAMRTFGWIEIAVGFFAFFSCDLFYGVLYRRMGWLYEGPLLAAAAHVLALLVPTLLMGMSLPFLVRARVRDAASAPRLVSALYGVNVLGSAAGALLAPWLLVRELGIDGAVRLAAAGSVLAGVGALLVGADPDPDAVKARGEDPGRGGGGGEGEGTFGLWLALYGFGGFAALSLEIIWFRVLGISIKSSAFTFGTVLALILFGLGAGSLAGGRLAPRLGRPVAAFLLCVTGSLAASALSLAALSRLPANAPLLSSLVRYWGRYDGLTHDFARPEYYLVLYVVLPALVLGVPTLLMGLSFAILQGAVQDEVRTSGLKTGLLQAVNVVGCVAGTVVVGTVGLDRLGAIGTLRALVLGGAAVALGAAFRPGPWKLFVPASALLLAAAATLPLGEAFWSRLLGQSAGVLVEEDATSVVAMFPDRTGARVRMSVDGLGISWVPYGGVHTWLGAVPVLVHPDPRDVAVIGLGSGDSAWAAACRPGTRSVTVFEISAPQLRVLRRLRESGPDPDLGKLLDDPRVRVVVADGRNALERGETRYDAIETDALRPDSAGAGNLYSVEFFRLCAERLKPGGVLCTWSPTPRVRAGVLSVFPFVLELAGGSVLVGGRAPLREEALRAAASRATSSEVVAYLGATRAAELARLFDAGRVLEATAPAPDHAVNRDLFPRDEFRAR